MNYEKVCQKLIQLIKDCVDSKDFLSTFCNPNHFVRSRKLSLKQVVLFLFHASKRCLYLDMDSIMQHFPSLQFPAVSKQALSKARLKIIPELFQTLFQKTALEFYKNCNSTGNWHGYHLFAIDGSKIMVPHTKQNQSFFGCTSNQKARIISSMGAASILYDIDHDFIANATLNNYLYSEEKSAESHFDFLEENGLISNAVILADRGYPSYSVFKRISEAGYFYVMRVQKNIKTLTSLKADDGIVEYLPTHLQRTDSPKIKVRVLRVTLDNNSEEWLATNIFDPSLKVEDFKELYFQRWKIESKYHELKLQLELEEFTGCHPISIQQDFFIHLILSNIGAMIKKEADKRIHKNTRGKKNKFRYQAKRSCILGNLKEMLLRAFLGIKDIHTEIRELIERSTKRRSQVQPNRKCKRPRVQLQRHHFNNRKTCM